MRRRLLTCLFAFAALAALGVTSGAPRAAAAPLACPAQFQMLHPEAIGEQTFQAGGYEIKVGDPRRLSCASATKAFGEFLTDADGVLRKPWIQVPGRLIYSRGVGSLTQFAVRRASELNPAIPVAGNPTAYGCTGYVRLSHDDHIGALAMPRGAYRISLINPATTNCRAATAQLRRFLEDFDGAPVPPWRADPRSGLFRKGAGSPVGFRVRKAVGPEPAPATGSTFPVKGQPRECKGTFRVGGQGDRIGALSLPSGNYLLFPQKGSGLSCGATARAFSSFLRARGNRLPRHWKVNTGTGTFRKGKRPGFRVKPALKPVAKIQPASR